jgi:guanylate kinase
VSSPDFFKFEPSPLLIVISGPSGVGKDSVIRCMRQRGLPFLFVITATTRPPRPGEVHGRDYFFKSKDEFAEMIEKDELIEYAIVYEDYKGVPTEQVRTALASGKDVVMRVDVQGAESVKALAPEVLLIFLTTETEDELVKRMKARAGAEKEDLNLRIAMARQELKQISRFDYVIVNRECRLDETVDAIEAIIEAEHHKVHHRKVSL